ncbi:MAG: hypothetical protein PHV48_03970, partial [Candidatus Omnitrophica bacterium]|nr:hypothetical protein [Candidatus Omnitrophota bacterium]
MRRDSIIMMILVLLILCFIFLGCFENKDDLSRYPKVAIPGYTAKDYYVFLFDKDSELVYNAVCNMIEEADSMGSILSDKKADNKSDRYILASNTYKRMVELLKSRDDRIVSACLRFLQIFGRKYDKKEELIEPVLKIGRRRQNVRYEKLVTLSAIVSKNSPVSDEFLKRSLIDRSWLVSRATYDLIDRLENEKMRSMLSARYALTAAEYEKLLILTSMRHGLSSGIFAFLGKEALETKNVKIKNLILRSLRNARNTFEALEWVDDNYEKLSSGDIKEMRAGTTIDDDFTSLLYGVCIRKGWVPDNDFFMDMYERIYTPASNAGEYPSEEDIKRRDNVQRLEAEIAGNKMAADKWQ